MGHETTTLRLLLAVAFLVAPGAAGADGLSSVLRHRIERYVEQRVQGDYDSIEVPSLGDFELPGVDPASLRIQLSSRGRGRSGNAIPVSVVVSDERRVLKRGVVTARVQASRSVWVAARPLRRGDPLREEDLRLERRDAARLPDQATGDLGSLIGRQLQRSVREGRPVETRWVKAPAVIERGELVRVVLARGGLRIEGRGKAVTDGALGERIRVLNLDSRREIVGRVAEDGSVHVGM